MNKLIKMSYADKDIRLTVDENEKLVKAEVRRKDDPNKWIEVKSSWVGKTPSWNKLDEFLSEIAGVKNQKRRLFDSFENVKEQLFDAPSEVKEAFNSVVGWFDTEYFEGKGGNSFTVVALKGGQIIRRDVVAGSKVGAINRFKSDNSGCKGSLEKIEAFYKNDTDAINRYEKELRGGSSGSSTSGKISPSPYIVVGVLDNGQGLLDVKESWFNANSEKEAIDLFKEYFKGNKCTQVKAFKTQFEEVVSGKSGKVSKRPKESEEAKKYWKELWNNNIK